MSALPMAALLDLSPGTVFAEQFRVVRPLAKGGMGAVYVVEQLGTARERALKLMHPLLAADERSVERFTREAQVASRIDSDHVVEVVAAGVEPKSLTPWLCMELLLGETLAERVERSGRLSVAETRAVFEQLGHALSAAHRSGIVHRDLKPENIFLATPRRAGIPFTLKVLDFGVAAIVHESSGGAGAKTTQGVGSPMWMAPEQTNVGRVTCATDVWALALIAFYLLTGKSYWKAPTIEGSSLTALLVEIMIEPLAPASLRAEDLLAKGLLPPGFDAWFSRALARDPGHRYPEAGVAIADLVAVLEASEHGRAPAQLGGAQVAAAFAETGAMSSAMSSVPPAGLPATMAAPLPLRVPGPSRDVPTAVNVRGRVPRSRWMWVVFGALGFLGGGGCLMLVIVMGIAAEDPFATLPPPSEGDDIHFGPSGVEIHTRQGDSISLDRDGIRVDRDAVQAEEDDVAEDDDVEGDETDEHETDEGDEGETEAALAPVPPPAPHPSHARPARDSAVAREARHAVIDACWRDTFEGETPPPSARWTFDFQLDGANRATNVRITGPTGGPYASFRACVVTRVGRFTSPDGTDHVAVTLP